MQFLCLGRLLLRMFKPLNICYKKIERDRKMPGNSLAETGEKNGKIRVF